MKIDIEKDFLVIWDDAQLLQLENGIPKDRLVYIMRRMWDIPETQNAVLEMLSKNYPNVAAVCCVLNPHKDRISTIENNKKEKE